MQSALAIASAVMSSQGQKSLFEDLSHTQRRVLKHPLFRMVAVTFAGYAMTKDWVVAVAFAFVYFVVVRTLLDERHPLSLIYDPGYIARVPDVLVPDTVSVVSMGVPEAVSRWRKVA